jgi:hypothetical protein
MTPFHAYEKYVAMKLHFKDHRYDYFRCKGKVGLSNSHFEVRKDKSYFYKISKIYNEEQYHTFLLSNFLENKNVWVGDLISTSAKNVYLDYKKNIESIEYTFKNDMEKIKSLIDTKVIGDFDEIFKIKQDSTYPLIVEMVFQKDISFISFIILNKILNFIKNIDKKIDDRLFWGEFKVKCDKYSPFLSIDSVKYRNILKDFFIKKLVNL